MSDNTEVRHLHLRGVTGQVTREMVGRREHLVVPVVALMEGVIHAVNAETPEFVPLSTLERGAASWNDKPAVLFHPKRDGKHCSAQRDDVIAESGLGTLRNATVSGKKMSLEALIDVAKAKQLHPNMLADLEAGKPVEVSVGAAVVTDKTPGVWNGKKYKASWTFAQGDHLAFLPGGRGACSIEMGCGAHRAASHRFAEDIEVLGDQPGHEFHGNQYSGGQGGQLEHAGKPVVAGRDLTTDQLTHLRVQDSKDAKTVHDYEKQPNGDWHHTGTYTSQGRGKSQAATKGSGKVQPDLQTKLEKIGGPRPELPKGVGKTGAKAYEGPLGDAMRSGTHLKDLGDHPMTRSLSDTMHDIMGCVTFLALDGDQTLDERMRAVYDAVNDEFNEAPDPTAYVRAVFDDRVIVQKGDETFSCPYVVGKDGEVTIGKMTPVVQQWVAAQAAHDCGCNDTCDDCKHRAAAGARHSGTDMTMIQAIHDKASELGADCKGGLRDMSATDAETRFCRSISQAERDKIPAEDFAGPNRTFFIQVPGDVSAAAHSLGRTSGNTDTVKAKIVSIAYRKGATFVAELPDDWKKTKDRAADGIKHEGGVWNVYSTIDPARRLGSHNTFEEAEAQQKQIEQRLAELSKAS